MKKLSFDSLVLAGVVLTVLAGASGCATQRRVQQMTAQQVRANIQLPQQSDYVPEMKNITAPKRDTLKVTDLDGNEMIIMKAIRDEASGDMVAVDVLDAAVVTARFRNIAERNGKVDLEFQVIVPQSLQDSKWQCRFYPDMFILQDSVRLDEIFITGLAYRKEQLRGYQQYERFLQKIATDSTGYYDYRNFEIFIQRNIPQVYAMKHDTTYVSDERFYSFFGISDQEALEHYKKKLAARRNRRLIKNRQKMFNKYVKVPFVTEGIRLDTVIRNDSGDFVYNYIQTINTRPKLRKVDIVLSGEIYEMDKRIYVVPPTDTLTFYISSVSAFVDNTERYKTVVISRNLEANTVCNIDFKAGKHDIDERMGENAREIAFIKQNLRDLLLNETYELDSVTIAASASPEGTVASNNALTLRRSKTVSDYFSKYIDFVRDSLRREEGLFITIGDDMSESSMRSSGRSRRSISFKSKSGGEDWETLDELVQADTTLTDDQKVRFSELLNISNFDEREKRLKSESFYKYVVDKYYPQLRRVRFTFALHRKGMVKDTVHTTELDMDYMNGVQAIRDHDYERAIALLAPYQDLNTAVAYLALDRNLSAMNILQDMPRTAPVNYMLALIYARQGDDQNAVQHYLNSCQQDRSYVNRGNLDPEIAALIRKYELNKQEDDDDWGDLGGLYD